MTQYEEMTHMAQLNILHVEDNEADVFFIKEGFKSSDLKPMLQSVEDGDKALEYLERKGEYQNAPVPDLILLDLNMPKTDGFTVLEQLKKHPELRRIPVIVFTSSNAPGDIQKSYDLHANSYVLKPIGLDEMMNTISVIEKFWFGLNRFSA
jgi:CheY-like chemotaxis protein